MFKLFARAIIINDNNNVLLIRKNKQQKIGPGVWMLPGGTLEFGENMIDCLIREVEEEVGLDITEATLFSERKMIIDDTHRVGLYYLCEVSDFDAINKEPEKHDEVTWMSLESLPEMFDKEVILTVFGEDV